MPRPAHAKPLHPPATEAEKNRASEIFTAASDDMVARGYARHLWGNQSGAAQEFIILQIRLADASKPAA
jgi:hypothetical protein